MSEKENKHLIKIALWGTLSIFLIWSLSAILILNVLPENEAHGTFGDLFGAINALFSGLAFLGVIIAILLQKEELEEQRKEIRQSRIAQDKSAVALKEQSEISGLMARLDAMNHILASLDRRISREKNSQKFDSDAIINELTIKQRKYEILLEKIISKIELSEENQNDRD